MTTALTPQPPPPERERGGDHAFLVGRWIWADAHDPNQYLAFARTVELPQSPGPLLLRVAASSSYELFVDGEFVARGPVHGDPRWCLYDELSLAPSPGARQLHITFVAHHSEGTRILSLLPAPGGLIAELSGRGLAVGTDASWRCLPLPMWRQDVAERGWALDYCEDYDAAREPPGWQGRLFPAEQVAAWPYARELDAPEATWGGHEARPVPYLEHRSIEPASFSAYRAPGQGAAPIGDVSRYCDEEELEPVARDLPFDLGRVNELAQTCNAFTFDLGAEHIGFYELEIEAPAGVAIELSGAELLRDGRPWIFRKNTRYSVRYRSRAGRQRFRPFGWSGFRYLHVVVRGGASIRFHRVGCLERRAPLRLARPFASADPALQGIFELCRRTLEVGVQEHLIDCPTREQAQYWGDAVFIAESLWRGFDEPRYLRWFLDCFLHAPLNAIGQLSCVYPGEHQTLLDYSLIPLLGQRFYREHTGGYYRPRESCQKALQLKAWYDARRDGRGLVRAAAAERIGEVNVVNFIDHPGLGWHDFPHRGIDREGVSCPLNIFFYGFLGVLADMLAEVDPAEGLAVRRQAADLAAAIEGQFFDGQVFHDARDGDILSDGTSWQTNALAVYFGLARGERATRVMRAMLGGYDRLCRCSPYFHFYFLPALRMAGLEEEALALIRREWGPMLDAGATTAWEGFAGDAKDSLCHPWSTAPFLHLITAS